MGIISVIKKSNYKIAIWEITETLEELLEIGSPIKIPDFNNKKRRLEWLIIRLLIQKISPKSTLSYNKFKAPILNDNNYISISHSKTLVAIIISKRKAGMDIENISNKALEISSKFISKNNLKGLSSTKATLIWCCKEAIYKWHQKGGVDFIKDIIIPPFSIKEKGKITAQFKNTPLTLSYTKINSHFLVYVCN